jgi:hypothetical protein
MDVEGIEAGVEFAQFVLHTVTSCDVAVAVIGNTWLTVALPDGRRRLEQDDDLVRRELTEALSAGVHILPLLVDGAPMPLAQQLPDVLAPIAALNSFEVQPKTFRRDVDRLCSILSAILDKIDRERARTATQELEDLKRERASIDNRISLLEQSIRGRLSDAEKALREESFSCGPCRRC